MLIKQTKTKRQETLEFKITKLSQSSFWFSLGIRRRVDVRVNWFRTSVFIIIKKKFELRFESDIEENGQRTDSNFFETKEVLLLI